MDYIGIAILIATIVGAVRFVHIVAFKDGVTVGKSMGRMEVLEENLIRSTIMDKQMTEERAVVAQLVQETQSRYGTVTD